MIRLSKLLFLVGFLLVVNVFTILLLNQGQRADCSHLDNQLNQQAELIKHLRYTVKNLTSDHMTSSSSFRHPDQSQPSSKSQSPPANNADSASNQQLPVIYMITPTYARWTQKADLTRICQTLMHVRRLHWIVVEDSERKTVLVTRLLSGRNTCKVNGTQLSVRTRPDLRLGPSDPNWRKNRGVEQRNLALDWLREAASAGKLPGNEADRGGGGGGVVYFGDDDNTYDLAVFDEMRYTRKVSIWPVGLSGGIKFEGPTCKDGRVTSWYAAWGKERPYPIDMAGFAVNLDLLLSKPEARIDPDAVRGYLESSILEKVISGMEDLEAKADDCKKVLVWHTRTEKPKMKQEEKLIELKRPSNPFIEV